MQHIVGRGGHAVLNDNLLGSQTVVVVLELHGHAVLAHLAQLSASASGVCPGTIAQRVANRVIDIRDRLQRRTPRTGGIGIPLLAQGVAAAVVVVHPCRVIAPGGRVVLVIYPNYLSQRFVDISGSHAAALLADDVHTAVVGILEAHRRTSGCTLGNLCRQRHIAVGVIVTEHITVAAGQLA